MNSLIAFDTVCVERDGVRVLDGVSFALEPGERLAIVGANGSGKTTLLRAIVGLQNISSGRIDAFGRERRTEADFREVRLKAGYVFQDADDQLFCPTVLEDVAFGPMNIGLSDDEAMALAHKTLEQLDLHHLATRPVRRLSGGKKRMICLAGVLAMDPQVLLLDEPTNSLDASHVELLVDTLRKIDKAVIIVSHDRPVLDSLATRALAMREGRLEPVLLHRHPHVHDHSHGHAHGHVHMAASPRSKK